MNNQRIFSFTASPTGFQAENCTVQGVFRWDFDPITQKVGAHDATVSSLTPQYIFSGPGVPRYTFSAGYLDLTLVRQYEGLWGLGHGYRDTLRMQVILLVSYLDDAGAQQDEVLHTEECLFAGNRYYEP